MKREDNPTTIGDVTEMELTHGKVNLIKKWLPWGRYKYAGRVRFGFNKEKQMFYLGLTHKKSDRHFRIYLRPHEFDGIVNALINTRDEARRWGDSKQ